MVKWSIVIIGQNCEKFLDRCIQSVQRAAEKVGSCEIVFVDAGSDDNSLFIAKKYGLKIVICNRRVNSSVVRNLGLQVARGDYIQFIDCDIEMNENWLLSAQNFLDNNPDAAMVCGQLIEKNKNIYADFISKSYTKKRIGKLSTPIGGGGAIRKEVIKGIGGYNIILNRGQETELGIRLSKSGYNIWGIDAIYGTHELNIDNIFDFIKRAMIQGKGYAKVLAKSDKLFLQYYKMAFKNIILTYLIFILFFFLSYLTGFLTALIISCFILLVYFLFKLINNSVQNAFLLVIEKIFVLIGEFIYFPYFFFVLKRKNKPENFKGYVCHSSIETNTNPNPFLSIIVIGKNLNGFLDKTFQSLKKSLENLDFNYETVYIDSFSRDESVFISTNYGIKTYIIKPNLPCASIARNIGAKVTTGDYLCFIDGDIIVHDDFFRKLQNILRKSNQEAFTFQLNELVSNTFTRYLALWTRKLIGEVDGFIGGGGIINRKIFNKIKGYDINLIRGEETDLADRIKKEGVKIIGLDFDLGFHHLRINNLIDFINQVKKHSFFYSTILFFNRKDKLNFYRKSLKNLIYFLMSLVMIILLTIKLYLGHYYLLFLLSIPVFLIIYKLITKSPLFVLEKIIIVIFQFLYLIRFFYSPPTKNTDEDLEKFVEISEVIELQFKGTNGN